MSASLAMPHSSARVKLALQHQVPYGRGSLSLTEPSASRTSGDDRKSCTGEHRLEEYRTGGACASGFLVGTGRFELPTCRLGGDRSIHLSYVPAYCHY